MFRSRRTFLGFAAASAAVAATGPLLARQSADQERPPSDPFGSEPDLPRPNPRAVFAANQKNIKKDVAKLSDILRDMQKQLDSSDIKDILPLDVLRQTDEIERLAKHIRSLIQG